MPKNSPQYRKYSYNFLQEINIYQTLKLLLRECFWFFLKIFFMFNSILLPVYYFITIYRLSCTLCWTLQYHSGHFCQFWLLFCYYFVCCFFNRRVFLVVVSNVIHWLWMLIAIKWLQIAKKRWTLKIFDAKFKLFPVNSDSTKKYHASIFFFFFL